MAGERAALAEEFRAKNRKISFIDQKNAAQDRFKQRLGNLDDEFPFGINRKNIHTAGIINSRKLPTEKEAETDSLAYVVKSDNRYARAYANYIPGRVKRRIDVHELEQHAIAMIPECMLYQGYVVRHLNPRDYENPFIGQYAYRTQIENVKKEIEEKTLYWRNAESSIRRLM